MSTPNEPLQEFFSQFNFQGYTYDPHAPALEEFKRLYQARQWGPSKIKEHKTAFLLAVEGEQDPKGSLPGPNLIKFFREYEYQRFTHDLDAPVQSEFQRLVGLRGWGKANLSKVTRQFNKAVALDARKQSVHSASEPTNPKSQEMQEVDLLADWLRKQECPGYRYQGGLPELEFRELVDVKYREWSRGQNFPNERKQGMSGVGRGAWRGSPEFKLLRTQFYGVVEEVFNLLLDKVCRITGFTRWQVLVGLYGQGQQGVGKQAAQTILNKVFINIFDFLDAFKEILKNPPTPNGRKLLRLLKPLAIELQFPNNLMLGVYSALTNRVFPLEAVDRDGTLVLLLHRIKLFLENFGDVMKHFEEEAGAELLEAEKEGRAGVRRLLLSREWASLRPLRSTGKSVPF